MCVRVQESAPICGMKWDFCVCACVFMCIHVQEKERTGYEESHEDQNYLQSPFCSSLNLIKGNIT